ncbi:hypothetical protein RCH06_002611 [Polaromonas sp. CG_9.5]|nr:hypothetical protein [Polaromonas sp. CG_9.5]
MQFVQHFPLAAWSASFARTVLQMNPLLQASRDAHFLSGSNPWQPHTAFINFYQEFHHVHIHSASFVEHFAPFTG